MDINYIYQVLTDAAQRLGPIGITVSAMQGAAKAAGSSAFDAIKTWFRKSGSQVSEAADVIEKISVDPSDNVAKAALRELLENNSAVLDSDEFKSKLSELSQALNIASGGHINIGTQNADKIVNASSINNLTIN